MTSIFRQAKKAIIAVEFFCYAEVKREKLVSIFFKVPDV